MDGQAVQDHEKVYVYCENMCKEEGMTKDQINALVGDIDTLLTALDTGAGVTLPEETA